MDAVAFALANTVQRESARPKVIEERTPSPSTSSLIGREVVPGIIFCASNDHNSANCYKYDIELDTWTGIASLPTTRSASGIAWVDGRSLHFYGGKNSSNTQTTTHYRYDIVGNVWSSEANAIGKHEAHGAPMGGSLLLAVGGQIGTTKQSSVQQYDDDTDTWTTKVSTPDVASSAPCIWDGGDYVYRLNSVSGLSVYRYTISGNIWTALANIPGQAGFTSVAHLGDKILAITSGTNGEVYLYDIAGDMWETVDLIPPPYSTLAFADQPNRDFGLFIEMTNVSVFEIDLVWVPKSFKALLGWLVSN